MTIPDALPIWATTGTKTEPSTQRKQIGHEFGRPPAYDHENYWKNLVYQWLDATKGSITFPDIQTAVEDLTRPVSGVPMEYTCIIDEYDADQEPGSVHTDVDTGSDVVSADVTGKSVCYIESGAAAGFAVERDLTTAVATYTKTNAGANQRIISNGSVTVIAYGTWVEAFDHDTGASQWTYDHGAAVYDIAMDGTHVYVVGELGTGNKNARALTLAAGAATWSYQHTATGGDELWSVATNGRQVFVAGDASSYGSGANLRALRADNGYDAANEGGTGADTTGSAWDIVTPGVIAVNERLATDGRRLYCGFSAASPRQIEIRGCSDGAVQASVSLGNAPSSLAVDQDLLILGMGPVGGAYPVYALDKFTLAGAWTWLNTAAGAPTIRCVASDGCGVFVGSTTTGTRALSRLYRGNRPGVWRRIDPTDDYLPMRQLIIPHQ